MSDKEFEPGASNVIPLFGGRQEQGLDVHITGQGTNHVEVIFGESGMNGVDPATIVYPSPGGAPEEALDLILKSDNPSLLPEERLRLLGQAKEIIRTYREGLSK